MLQRPQSRFLHMPGGVRIALALLFLAAAAALLVPAAALAKVDKKYAARYSNGVGGLAGQEKTSRETYNAYVSFLNDTADTIKELLSANPVDEDALANARNEAARGAQNVTTLIRTPWHLEVGAKTFRTKVEGWFSSPADRTMAYQGATDVALGADLVQRAFQDLSDAFKRLAADPPAIDRAREYGASAAQRTDLAKKKFDTGFALLRSLQR
jgi:hypothetical protein